MTSKRSYLSFFFLIKRKALRRFTPLSSPHITVIPTITIVIPGIDCLLIQWAVPLEITALATTQPQDVSFRASRPWKKPWNHPHPAPHRYLLTGYEHDIGVDQYKPSYFVVSIGWQYLEKWC